MAKTKPIGVRFRTEMLDFIKNKVGADTPQQALVYLENFYRTYHELASPEDILRLETMKSEVINLSEEINYLKTENSALKEEIERLKLVPIQKTSIDLNKILAEAASQSIKK